MKYAAIGPIAVHLPDRVETNEQLKAAFPDWDMDQIFEKTGIAQRHIASPRECASDLGVAACQKLFDQHGIDPSSIDFLMFCTQTPDYPLPTTACLMQERLGLRTSAGAIDYNLGCSGYVYGLAMADGLIRTGVADRILLVTAETYSKYIDPSDRSLRTIFGDGAAATLIEANSQQTLGSFRFGTDGSGADTLLVAQGGARHADDAHRPRNRKRWPSALYMDGPTLLTFTLDAIPGLVRDILGDAGLGMDDIDLFLMHQATRKMMVGLQQRLGVDESRLPVELAKWGNTVSSTIPILIEQMRRQQRLAADQRCLLVGFGVGWSWGGCLWDAS